MSDKLTESEQEVINKLHKAATELELLYKECRKLSRSNNELKWENSILKRRLAAIEQAVRGD